MLSEQERAQVKAVFEQKRLIYFECADRETPLQCLCGDFLIREQRWLDREVNDRHKKQSRVLLAFFESDETQAYAFETAEDIAVIGISSFFAIQFGVLFYNAFSNRTFLPNIGNIKLELLLDDLKQMNLMQRRPRCPQRLKAAQTAGGIAFRFLVAHEFSHILNGHLRLKLGQQKIAAMAEHTYGLTEREALEKQTLEMDADSGAVRSTLNSVLMPLEALQAEDNLGWDPFYRDREKITMLWCLAIYALFRNLDSGRFSIDHSSHPPPVKRSMMAFGTFLALEERDHIGIKSLPIAKAMQESQIAFEHIHAWILGQPPDTNPLKEALALVGYEAKLLIEWARLRPLLKPLNRGAGRLAPIQVF